MIRPHPLDLAVAWLGARTPMFSQGWGDPAVLARVADGALEAALAECSDRAVSLQLVRERSVGRGRVVDVAFPSPASHLLPEGVAEAHARWLQPLRPRPTRAAVVVLAASREEGYSLRQSIYGPLAFEEGFDVLLLENPFYGRRRGARQKSASLGTVAEQLCMHVATIAEARSLLHALAERGIERQGVAGFSMGGSMAALTGALVREPIAVTAMATSLAPGPIFTEGLLSKSVALAALARGTSRESARDELARILDIASLARFAPPVASHAAIVVGCTHDAFVAREGTAALASHWGAELRWVRGGHSSVLFTQRAALRSAVRDALGRLGT